jgi:hypothetical protein
MLDMSRRVRPPDERDDTADETQKKQKSQRVEAIGLAVPTMPASHTILPFSAVPVLARVYRK